MKGRVLSNLQEIASEGESDMLEVLKAEMSSELTEPLIRHRASEAYELIIHNYSRFEISTIDSFFSRVVRSFSKELDIPMSYELEMNTAVALEEAVSQLFKSLSENKELRIWLEQYTFDQIENDKSWNVEGNIIELGKNLFKEQFQEGFSRVEVTLDRLKELVGEMKEKISFYKKTLIAAAKVGISSIEGAGLSIQDFAGKSSSAANTFYKIRDREDFTLTKTFIATAAGEKSWYTKTSDRAQEIDLLINGDMGRAAKAILDCVEKYQREYLTAKALFRNIYSFGLLEALNANLKAYRDEQNIMLISDNNALIREIVREDDAPFIYEKIGSFFKHILIDEFQDTSNFQWNNLLPLILNSLSSGNQVLIVGDVKQSIYRFRGGNMRLLLDQVDRDLDLFKEVITYKNLEENYRSLKSIVEFNNAFFDQLPKAMDLIEHVEDLSLIERAYKGHSQIPKHGEGGFVQVLLYQTHEELEKPWRERALDSLVDNIRVNIDLGHDYEDFLILVNKNSDMSEIARHLLESDIPFVSDRSLMLKNNDLVRFLIETLRFLQTEEDDIGLVNLVHLYNRLKEGTEQDYFVKRIETVEGIGQFGLPKTFLEQRRLLAQMPLFDLIEQLLLCFNFREQGDVFIQRFQDLVLEQTQKGIHSIHGFLEWWEEQGKDSTISGNENAKAVRIMSVHKSKGLESPIVMVPFADYSFLPNATIHSFWTDEVPDYLKDLSFVPLNYSKSGLINTDFEKAFKEETLESVMDALNKTYVAFTRAKEKLYIAGPQKNKGRDGSLTSINQFLEELLESSALRIIKNENNNILKYEYNSIQNKITNTETREGIAELDTYPNASYIDHLSIRADSGRFFMLQDTRDAQNISLGNQIHEVLSMMTHSADVDAVLRQLTLDGTLPVAVVPVIREQVSKLMDNPQIKSWFESDFNVLAEREMFYEGKILKPDRVMVKGEQAIIVDYKKEKASETYHTQVGRYMKAVQSLGYSEVSGFLVYVDPVEIEEVLI